ncbi:serpin B3 [Biomphalaria glabrata]|uniref:Serpin B3-like n=1 Tax=Biomphalaria glabrata TaxID=6526 RepID=A0A9U8EI09_BIOGL|nr:serpin B3-like [Biomphalaria glabrata]KAI8737135.1 serpin B3-like [Biomphalaria glabrata]
MLSKAVFLLVAVSLGAQSGFAQDDHPNITDVEVLAEAVSMFSLDVFNKLHTESKNLLFSPLSGHSALSMVMLGAWNKTLDNFHELLKIEDPYTAYIELFQDYETMPGIDIVLANGIWAKPTFPIKDEYKGHVGHIFQVEPKTIDISAPKGPEEPINAWVANRTNNAITTILPPSFITADTDILFLNVFFLNASWESPFDASKTQDGEFVTESGETIRTSFMRRDDVEVEVGEMEGFAAKVLRLPFKNYGFAFYIALPNENETLSRLHDFMVNELHDSELFFAHLQTTKVNLYVPKFQLTSTLNISKKSSMGLDFLFDPDADFSELSEKHLALSSGVHKVFIDVKETGIVSTETPVFEGRQSRDSSEDFVVKRPFIFFVRDDVKGLLLFQGKLSDPRVTEVDY